MKRKIGLLLRLLGIILVIISIGEAINIIEPTTAKIIRAIGFLTISIGIIFALKSNKSL
ncbi:hypothetical protein [Clostridium sp. ZS2-4]|uniref:hypothetical protein n=1 Tax=Clostridium sp. ZS2-4 TaxID=2987703 RepID=UPI00227CE369|nr:hypothetical protein [Clostridium sp. ZS2-4]MCY6355354.1 hypothetical protein [Clostridium sp. ZS2-4]